MFTPEQRASIRSALLDYAAKDRRIVGAAITGSGAAGHEDRWSDIDLAFGVIDASELPNVLSDWTAHMYDHHQAVHHLDVRFGAWTCRVFLLSSTLQIDLAFVPANQFRPLAPTFRLVFGAANEPIEIPSPQPGDIIGMGWLYALHARSCIARGRFWQAEYMISSIRDHALALACVRHDLPAAHGRGFDMLPAELSDSFKGSLIRGLDADELTRAFRVVVHAYLSEVRQADADLAGRLQETVLHLIDNFS